MPSDKRKSVSQPRFIPSFLQTGRLLTAFYVSPTFYPVMDAFCSDNKHLDITSCICKIKTASEMHVAPQMFYDGTRYQGDTRAV